MLPQPSKDLQYFSFRRGTFDIMRYHEYIESRNVVWLHFGSPYRYMYTHKNMFSVGETLNAIRAWQQHASFSFMGHGNLKITCWKKNIKIQNCILFGFMLVFGGAYIANVHVTNEVYSKCICIYSAYIYLCWGEISYTEGLIWAFLAGAFGCCLFSPFFFCSMRRSQDLSTGWHLSI